LGITVESGDTITFYYEGSVEDGSTFHLFDDAPLSVEIGNSGLVKGLEAGIIGMEEGQEKNFQVSPEDGYGVENPDLVQTVDPKLLAEPGIEPKIGTVIQTPHGNCHITNISDDNVEISYNHPLAGRTLTYTVKIITIKKP